MRLADVVAMAALVLAASIEWAIVGYRSGPGWLILVLLSLGIVLVLQRRLERQASPWTCTLARCAATATSTGTPPAAAANARRGSRLTARPTFRRR